MAKEQGTHGKEEERTQRLGIKKSKQSTFFKVESFPEMQKLNAFCATAEVRCVAGTGPGVTAGRNEGSGEGENTRGVCRREAFTSVALVANKDFSP